MYPYSRNLNTLIATCTPEHQRPCAPKIRRNDTEEECTSSWNLDKHMLTYLKWYVNLKTLNIHVIVGLAAEAVAYK